MIELLKNIKNIFKYRKFKYKKNDYVKFKNYMGNTSEGIIITLFKRKIYNLGEYVINEEYWIKDIYNNILNVPQYDIINKLSNNEIQNFNINKNLIKFNL